MIAACQMQYVVMLYIIININLVDPRLPTICSQNSSFVGKATKGYSRNFDLVVS